MFNFTNTNRFLNQKNCSVNLKISDSQISKELFLLYKEYRVSLLNHQNLRGNRKNDFPRCLKNISQNNREGKKQQHEKLLDDFESNEVRTVS